MLRVDLGVAQPRAVHKGHGGSHAPRPRSRLYQWQPGQPEGRDCGGDVVDLEAHMVERWSATVQEPLDGAGTVRLEQLHEAVAHAEHPLDEAVPQLLADVLQR